MFHISLRMPNYIGTDHRSEFMNKLSFHRHGIISKNKAWESQIEYFGWGNLFEFKLSLDNRGTDHASYAIELTLFGMMFEAHIHDRRHWNHDNDQWEVYNENAESEENLKWEAARDKEAWNRLIKQYCTEHEIGDLESPEVLAAITHEVQVRSLRFDIEKLSSKLTHLENNNVKDAPIYIQTKLKLQTLQEELEKVNVD